MSKTLVTGSNGLVGFALKELHSIECDYISRFDVDLTDYIATSDIFRKANPSQVIHLAAQVGGIGGNLIHSGEYFRNNILINTNVLECARQSGVQKLISFMSTCVFPDKSPYPLKEADLHKGPPHPSNFGYAYAKRMLEVQSSAYRKEWNCNFIVAIPTNIYGPNDYYNLKEGHVVPALIHKTYLAKKNGEELNIWGSGKPLREFVYSYDIAKLTKWAMENYNMEEPIIFSSGIETSIMELVETIAKKMQFNGKIVFDSSKPDGQFRKPSDTTKLKRLNPNFQWTPLEEGIEKTVDWFLRNYPKVRL